MFFSGTYTALVTPFEASGDVDEPALRRMLEYQIVGGVSGVVLFGSTGEGVALTRQERERYLVTAVEAVSGRTQVIAGIAGSGTAQVADEVRSVSTLGVDGVMVSSPAYNKPGQDGLRAHFEAVGDASSVPVMLYNIPGRTAATLRPSTTLALAGHPQIQAVKEAAGLGSLQEVVGGAQEEFSVLVGDDDLALPGMALGAHGLVSVVSNQAPALTVALIEAMQAADLERARALHFAMLPLIQANFSETNPTPVKAGLAAMGLIEDVLRLPLVSATSTSREAVVKGLARLDLVHVEEPVS